jgi:hypothetical protein
MTGWKTLSLRISTTTMPRAKQTAKKQWRYQAIKRLAVLLDEGKEGTTVEAGAHATTAAGAQPDKPLPGAPCMSHSTPPDKKHDALKDMIAQNKLACGFCLQMRSIFDFSKSQVNLALG